MLMYLRFITFQTTTDFNAKFANGVNGTPSERLMQHQQTVHFANLRTRLLERLGARLVMHGAASACGCKSATDFHAAFCQPL